MELHFNTAFYIDGWEILGRCTVDATVSDASFSSSYGSITATQPATDSTVDFVAFMPDDLAADLRLQFGWTRPGLTRKRARHERRQLARRITAKLREWWPFNDWLNENERRVWEAHQVAVLHAQEDEP